VVDITYFVHCTTTDNQAHLATGWLPGELSEAGREQAKKLGEQAADKHFDIVFCSDLRRAVDTANLGFGENYKDVEKRMAEFLTYLKQNYNGKRAAIVAHQAPQLALDVLLKGKIWQQAIDEDWCKTKDWRPGWEYRVE
jgi:broad specificity phosphatase PhoE